MTICQNPAEVEDFLAIGLPDYASPGWPVLLLHQQACGVSEMDTAGGPAEAGGLIQKGPTNIWGGVAVTATADVIHQRWQKWMSGELSGCRDRKRSEHGKRSSLTRWSGRGGCCHSGSESKGESTRGATRGAAG
jgi:hypothetical protein